MGFFRWLSDRSFTYWAWTDFGLRAAVWSASFAAAACVFVPFAASVAGASVRFAHFSLGSPVATGAGGPALASAGVFGGPVPASRTTFPAVACISGPV